MSTAMSKAESNALVVSYDVLGTHVELDLDFVKKYLVRGRAELVSNQELVSETSLLNMFLENRKMKKMIMSPKSNGTLYPMLQRPPEKMKLDNFVWFDYIRPLDKEDIFKWRGKKAGQGLKKSNRSAVPLPNHNLFNKKK